MRSPTGVAVLNIVRSIANLNKLGYLREAMVWEMKAKCTSLASIRLLFVER
jgi:hypothetical protein